MAFSTSNLSPLYLEDSGPVNVITIESTWRDAGKKKKKVKEEGIQVHLSHRRHGKGVQTTEKVSAAAQTLDPNDTPIVREKEDTAGGSICDGSGGTGWDVLDGSGVMGQKLDIQCAECRNEMELGQPH